MGSEVVRHAERIFAVTRPGKRNRVTPPEPGIASSWSRCLEQYGIDPSQRHRTRVLDRNGLLDRCQRLGELMEIARLEMDNLYQQIAGSGYAIILTDKEGVILDNVTDPARIADYKRAGLWLGALWAEDQEGTNGIGTCLIEKRPVTIHQDEHFRGNNIGLTCSGAPIFDTGGNLLAVLDASSTSSRDSKQSQFHTTALVTLSAKLIENCNFLHRFRGQWVLRFHNRSEFIGMISEGMVAFDGEGRILALNQGALNQLDCGRHEPLPGRPVGEVFDIDMDQLMARASRQPSAVWPLRDHRGRPLFAMLVGAQAGCMKPVRPSPMVVRSPVEVLDLEELAGDDPQMIYNVRCARRLLDKEISIILSGETGTGKEAFALALHAASARADKPFLALNCAAIPEQLIESELFGYRDGAFTGARRGGMRGKIEQANGGTLFLDEIGDMPLHLQTRLLRVLEERSVIPLGGDKPICVDIQIVSATHQDLEVLIEQGRFREDLFYRLNGFTIRQPALRERRDFDRLAMSLLTAEEGDEPIGLDPAALRVLRNYPWPGNIRQLRNVLRTALALSDGAMIRVADLPPELTRQSPLEVTVDPDSATGDHDDAGNALSHAEREALLRELHRNDWNISQSAAQLGISRNTMYRKLHKYGIRPSEQRE